MISNKGLVTISAFMSSCDDLINGKFIFAGNKISNILKSISDSPELYEVIAECLKEFNYEKEFGRAKVKLPTKKGTFKMPEDNMSLIPLVFCMLVEIEEQKIDFKQFLADYFDGDDEEVSQFENFANQVIVPFKNAIAYLFDIEGTNKFKPKEEKPEKVEKAPAKAVKVTSKEEQYFKDIKDINEDVVEMIEYIKIKPAIEDDLRYEIDALNRAIESKNIENVNAYVIAVIYIIKQVRKLRSFEAEYRIAMEDLYLDDLSCEEDDESEEDDD